MPDAERQHIIDCVYGNLFCLVVAFFRVTVAMLVSWGNCYSFFV
jgi:hypothetical protein